MTATPSAHDWTDVVQAIGTVSIPVVVAILAFVLSRTQSRSEELLRTRVDYYRQLVPDLNRLMCYMTFIGTWRDQSPPEVIALKRRLDETFFCAAPLFSPLVLKAYQALMARSFSTFGAWGADAKISSSAYRRRESWCATDQWAPEWDGYFALSDDTTISGADLESYQASYDRLIGALVRDLNVTRARSRYTSRDVVRNAHAPARADIAGALRR